MDYLLIAFGFAVVLLILAGQSCVYWIARHNRLKREYDESTSMALNLAGQQRSRIDALYTENQRLKTENAALDNEAAAARSHRDWPQAVLSDVIPLPAGFLYDDMAGCTPNLDRLIATGEMLGVELYGLIAEIQAIKTAKRAEIHARWTEVRPDYAGDVAKFVTKFVGSFPEIPGKPTLPEDSRVLNLCINLIEEESQETCNALCRSRNYVSNPETLAKIADGIGDLIYVAHYAAIRLGINLAPVWHAIQASNMAKTGGKTREDGKILKPEGWQPPDIVAIMKQQMGE